MAHKPIAVALVNVLLELDCTCFGRHTGQEMSEKSMMKGLEKG